MGTSEHGTSELEASRYLLPYNGIKKYVFVVVGREGCGSRVEGLWVEGVVGLGLKAEGCW